MIVHDIKQHLDDGEANPEWLALRHGIPTASAADKLLTPTGKLSAQSHNYMCQLIADIAGFPEPQMEPTEHMKNGNLREPEARALFEFEMGLTVTEIGFIHNDSKTAGISPDGIIYEDGIAVAGFETKSPMARTQISYLLDGGLPKYYKGQVHFSMAVTGLDKWWFQSYFPGLDPLIVLVEADDYTQKVADAIVGFAERLASESARIGITK
jgi:hypothetical protein